MSNTDKDVKEVLKVCFDALKQVQNNQKYQLKHGWPDFTSAPTEIEWKQESQDETDKMVDEAIRKVQMTLIDLTS